MPPEKQKWVKPYSLGKNKGVAIPIADEIYFDVLVVGNISPLLNRDYVRVSRYSGAPGTLIIAIKTLDKIKPDELSKKDREFRKEYLESKHICPTCHENVLIATHIDNGILISYLCRVCMTEWKGKKILFQGNLKKEHNRLLKMRKEV